MPDGLQVDMLNAGAAANAIETVAERITRVRDDIAADLAEQRDDGVRGLREKRAELQGQITLLGDPTAGMRALEAKRAEAAEVFMAASRAWRDANVAYQEQLNGVFTRQQAELELLRVARKDLAKVEADLAKVDGEGNGAEAG